jgi:cell division septum initiation protein DivIVA
MKQITNMKQWFYNTFCLKDQIKKLKNKVQYLQNALEVQTAINSNGKAENKRLVERINELESKIPNCETDN